MSTYGPNTFTQADGALNVADFDVAFGGFTVLNNEARGNTGRSALAVKTSVATFADDHECSVVYRAVGSSDLGGPAVRVDPVSGTGYCLALDGINSTSRMIRKFTATTDVAVGAAAALVPIVGDVWMLRATNIGGGVVRLEAFQNGSLVMTRDDSSSPHLTGQPGLWYNAQNNRITRLDNLTASDVGATQSNAPRSMRYHLSSTNR